MATVSPVVQAAAIPVWSGRIGLITSRNGKRWIVPKGHKEPDKTLEQTALQEAWEEAGLIGFLEEPAAGCYRYRKSGNLYHVTVFIMQVTQMAKHWPEAELRHRTWVAEDRAYQQVEPAGLQIVLRNLQALTAR